MEVVLLFPKEKEEEEEEEEEEEKNFLEIVNKTRNIESCVSDKYGPSPAAEENLGLLLTLLLLLLLRRRHAEMFSTCLITILENETKYTIQTPETPATRQSRGKESEMRASLEIVSVR